MKTTFYILILIVILSSSCQDKNLGIEAVKYSINQQRFIEVELLNYYYEDKFFTAKNMFPYRYDEIERLYFKFHQVKIIYNSLKLNKDQSILQNNYEIQQKIKKVILDSIENQRKKDYLEKDIDRIFYSDTLSLKSISHTKIKNLDSLELNYYTLILFAQKCKLLSLITNHIPTSMHSYYKNFIISVLDKGVVMKGEEITARTGIGEMTYVSQPQVFFNDKEVKLNNDLVAIYKFKASNKLGKNTLEVKVKQLQPDGTVQTTTEILKYNVVDTICKTKTLDK